MIITIFGATGMVGKQLVKQALWKGHIVKAFGRNVFTELNIEEKNLELIKGALFDEKDVLNAIKGSNAVLSCLGGDFTGNDKTRSLGMKIIVAQMQKANIKRIIGVGGMGVLQADDETLLIDTDDYPKEYVAVGKEHQLAYDALKNSNLEWTFVCPPDIINGDATGNFSVNANYPPITNQYKINAGDLAMFMLTELEKNEFLQQRVGISIN